MKKFLLCWAVLCGALALGCVQAERRGVLDGAYISTARPAISVRAAQLPLLGNGRWHIQLADTDMVGGLPVRVWLAVYGARRKARWPLWPMPKCRRAGSGTARVGGLSA